MKYNTILIGVFLAVSGCTLLNGWEHEMAENICKDHGGVDYIEGVPLTPKIVNCTDGTWYKLKQTGGDRSIK